MIALTDLIYFINFIMLKKLYILALFLTFIFSDIYDGYVLFTPSLDHSLDESIEHTTFLMDNDENIINSWVHDCKPSSISYLMPDSSLVYPCKETPFEPLNGDNGPMGGRVVKYSWQGDILWDFNVATSYMQPHHDIEVLDNGNILMLVFEKVSADEARALGMESINSSLDFIIPCKVIEVVPNGIDEEEIIWEWRFWDHLVQDVDPDKPNYGLISEHPERLDINVRPPTSSYGDWIHTNAIDFNEELDLIVISSRRTGEVYIIDHSTSTLDASSSSGGNYGMGGDFLYRWGKPSNYNSGNGENDFLLNPHGVNWINSNYPGGGNILVYNNRNFNTGSVVYEINLYLDNENQFLLNNDGFFDPKVPIWEYEIQGVFSMTQSGAYRLENGNTFITVSEAVHMREVDTDGGMVWSYEYAGPNVSIPRAQKLGLDYFYQPLTGDINSDSMVNIQDVIIVVGIVLDQQPSEELLSVSDLNSDGLVDILDVIVLVNIILS